MYGELKFSKYCLHQVEFYPHLLSSIRNDGISRIQKLFCDFQCGLEWLEFKKKNEKYIWGI